MSTRIDIKCLVRFETGEDGASISLFGGSHPYAENMQPFRDLMPRERNAFAAVI